MSCLRSRRQGIAFPVAVAVAAVVGATGLAFVAGQWLAYISLIFGILFFAFAARYYVAILSVLFAPSVSAANGKTAKGHVADGNGNEDYPMVSVHLALYNEERVVDRILTACSKLDYPNYEVVVVDDSTDGTVKILKDWILKQLSTSMPKIKIIHRDNRSGFKGGALNEALKNSNPKTEYVTIFDADFVPPPDILKKFLAYFNRHPSTGNGPEKTNGSAVGRYSNGKLAAVQGYQWHTLNRSENWLTRGISCEFSGNYMVDRTFQEVTGVMKMVAGSVYMIRADILQKYKWSGSITEDWELTLRLYERGHKVLFTPLVQAPGECPSTLGKLVKQRMRWAEGHTYNVKKHFIPVMLSPKLGIREKLEFLYFAPYYLQSLFLILGTFFWFSSDVVLGTRLPFWTATFGWALVFSNLLALPLMSITGLFFEKRARKDFPGIFSQFLLIYALSPYQAFAALKGLLEPVEGSWVRTFKTGKLAGFPGKLEPRKVIKNVLPPSRVSRPRPMIRAPLIIALGIAILFAAAAVHGGLSGTNFQPSYYFYNQVAPPSYTPFSTPSGFSFLMHTTPPTGSDSRVSIGDSRGSGPIFFSDPASGDTPLPFGASVSVHIWVDADGTSGEDSGSGMTNGLNAIAQWGHTTSGTTMSQTTESTTTADSCGNSSDNDGPRSPAILWSTTRTCTNAQTSQTTQTTQTTRTTHTTLTTHTTETTESQMGCDESETPGSSGSNPAPSLGDRTVTSTSASPEDDEVCGNLKVMIGIYNPADNTVRNIPGVVETLFHLQPGVNLYEASWGNIANNKVVPKGATIVATIWCPDCGIAPILLFNSQAHPSNVDFPIVVPENSIQAAGVALLVPATAGIVLDMRGGRARTKEAGPEEGGLRRVHRTLIVAAALILLTLPLVITFNSILTSLAIYTGFDRVVTTVVPLEASSVGDLLRGFGFPAGNSANSVWLAGGALPVVALIDWNCAGWQGFALFGLTSIAGMGEAEPKWKKLSVFAIGILGTFAVNVLRIMIVVMLGYFAGYPAALVFHDYGGTIMTLIWLLAFWGVILRPESADID